MLRASMNKITRAVGMLSRSPVAVCASEAAEKVKFESLSVARAPARARSGGQSQSKVTSSSYRSVSDSSRDGGRPLVEYSKSTDTKSTNLGPSGIPRTSVSHASSSYSSEDPYKNRVNSYSYNV